MVSLTRRTIARLTALVAVAGSVALGWLTDAFEVEGRARQSSDGGDAVATGETVRLPRPRTAEGDQRVGTAIADRRSRREYSDDPLTAAELGQLLWAAQGVTGRNFAREDFRAAPSAGATYPLEVFVVVGEEGVEGVEPGVYHYEVGAHELTVVERGDFQSELAAIAINQGFVAEAALDVVVTGVDERTTGRYGRRGRVRYVPMEAGHVGQNLYLQAESLGLATVAVGAFRDAQLRALLDVGDAQRPLYVFPVGRRA